MSLSQQQQQQQLQQHNNNTSNNNNNNDNNNEWMNRFLVPIAMHYTIFLFQLHIPVHGGNLLFLPVSLIQLPAAVTDARLKGNKSVNMFTVHTSQELSSMFRQQCEASRTAAAAAPELTVQDCNNE